MVDFYGLPSEGGGAWPGRDLATGINATAKAQFVEQALASAVMSEMGHSFDPHRFIPFIVMHEFEGLLFSDCSAFARAIGKGSLEPSLQTIRDQFETPEDINDSPSTAPSRRVQSVVAGYEKPLFGNIAAIEIGLRTIRAECAHFNRWMETLEKIAAI